MIYIPGSKIHTHSQEIQRPSFETDTVYPKQIVPPLILRCPWESATGVGNGNGRTPGWRSRRSEGRIQVRGRISSR